MLWLSPEFYPDHGVRAVMIQGAEFLLETYSRRLITDIRAEVK